MNPLKFITPSRAGTIGLLKFLKKNWYVIFFILAIIPSIIGSIEVAVETNNPLHPFLQVGISMANADAILDEYTLELRENPAELIGMSKPDEGFFDKMKYRWYLLKLIYKIMGSIFLITAPFMIIYKIMRGRNLSETYKNTTKTLWIGLLWIFFINLLLVIFKFTDGGMNYEFDEGITLEKKVMLIVFMNLPLHGLISLLAYLIKTLMAV